MFEILGITSLILTAASTAYGIVSSIQQANAQADMQRQQARAQAASLEEQARQEEQDQLQRSLIARRQNARKIAEAEAGYGASGVTLAGTPTLSLAQLSEELEMETAIEEGASLRKRNLLLTDAYNTLQFGNANAKYTKRAGYANAIGTGLMGAANLFAGGYNFGVKEGYIGSNTNTLLKK